MSSRIRLYIAPLMLFMGLSVALADKTDSRETNEGAQLRPDSMEWFIQAIRGLPSDEPVADRQPGYNNYRTQKDHWLGWLDPDSNTGTYPRRSAPERDARYVYNRIVEPQMLLWLISASGVRQELVHAAARAAEEAASLAGKSAAIRRHVPWQVVAAALAAHEAGNELGNVRDRERR